MVAGLVMGLLWGMSGPGLALVGWGADAVGVEAVLRWVGWIPLVGIPLLLKVPDRSVKKS